MGVRGLTTFVQETRLIEDIELHHTKLIIDGDGLFVTLFRESSKSDPRWLYGGDFGQFAATLRQYFDTLQQCHIEPIVVIDGAIDPSAAKIKTMIERHKERVQRCVQVVKEIPKSSPLRIGAMKEFPIPLVAHKIFQDVLEDLNVHHVKTLYEADNGIARLSNYFSAPVLSSDSDFFIFNLDHGCIMMRDADIVATTRTDPTTGQQISFIRCRRFMIDNLTKRYNTRPEVLPLVSAVLGNDYCPPHVFANFRLQMIHEGTYGPGRKGIDKIMQWIGNMNFEQLYAAIIKPLGKNRKTAKEYLNMTIEAYRIEKDFEPFRLECTLAHLRKIRCPVHDVNPTDTDPENNLPNWFLSHYINNRVSGLVLDIPLLDTVFINQQLEDIQCRSTLDITKPIISTMIALLRYDDEEAVPVKFHHRKGPNPFVDVIPPDAQSLPALFSTPKVKTIHSKVFAIHFMVRPQIIKRLDQWSWLTVELRKQFMVIDTLLIYLNKSPISVINQELMLATLTSLIYYCTMTLPTTEEVDQDHLDILTQVFRQFVTISEDRPPNLRILHGLAEIKSLMMAFSNFNCLLHWPAPELKACWFDGVLIHNLVTYLKDRPQPFQDLIDLLVPGSRAQRLLQSLLDAEMSYLYKVARFHKNKWTSKAKQPKKPEPKITTKPPKPPPKDIDDFNLDFVELTNFFEKSKEKNGRKNLKKSLPNEFDKLSIGGNQRRVPDTPMATTFVKVRGHNPSPNSVKTARRSAP